MNNPTTVSLENVNCFYGSYNVLSNITVAFPASEMTAIIGPNGGGKTTLLKIIAGLIRPDTGSVHIFGENIKVAREKALIGYVPQAAQFDRNFPIKVEDVLLSGTLHHQWIPFKRYSAEDKQKAKKVLEDMELFELRNRQIGQLSGGQLQKVLIARALINDPKLLLLDEPTASIDTQTKNQIYTKLNSLTPRMTILIVTHDMAAISSYFDTIACLNKKIHYHGSEKLTKGVIDETFGCPVDLIAHGVPHRVFKEDNEVYHD